MIKKNIPNAYMYKYIYIYNNINAYINEYIRVYMCIYTQGRRARIAKAIINRFQRQVAFDI